MPIIVGHDCICSVQSVEETQSRRNYIEALWWNMHHSYLPGKTTFALTNYFDDSGSDDLSPVTVLGGPVMSKDAFMEFSPRWDKLLKFCRIEPPVKMTDFVRPHGRLIGMYFENKVAFFRDAAKLINEYKLFSLSVSVDGKLFNEHMDEDVRRQVIGPYGLAFFFALMGNQGYSEVSLVHPAETMAYIIDSGFPYVEQLLAVHAGIIRVRKEKGRCCFVGSLTQDSDDSVPALQAADMIAWSARRRELGTLTEEFEPLRELLSKSPGHTHIPFPKGGIKMFAKTLENWRKNGKWPSSVDQIFS